jgi:hypothetical protein
MAKTFKVKYATRNKLARSLQKEIRSLGLVDEGTLYDSIKISAMTGTKLNVVEITINAIYYYLFLDEGTIVDNQQRIPPYYITENWLNRSDTQAILGEIAKEYVTWQFETYPFLEMAKILNQPQFEVKFNWIDSPYKNLPTKPSTLY